MRKLSVIVAVIIFSSIILNSKADAWFFWNSSHKNLSTIESPERFARLNSYPVEIIVQFKSKARTNTFNAWLNKKNITAKFEPFENGMRAFVGPEDGLRLSATSKWRIVPLINILKTRIRGPKRKKDIDIRMFRVEAVEDSDLPEITATVDPAPNTPGWNNTNVTVRFNCSDSTSGIATCSGPVTIETEGANQVVSGTAVDKAGNQASIAVTLNIDKTPPSLSQITDPLPNGNGWNNTSVTVSFQCSDMTSGIAACPDSVSVEAEGADQQVTGTALDMAGNQATETVLVNLDMTPPVIDMISPENGHVVFGHEPPFEVEVKGNVADDRSGIAEVTCNNTPVTLSGADFSLMFPLVNGTNTLTATALDLAGNSTTTQDIEVEYYEPEIEIAYVDDFNLIWSDYGSDGNFNASFFRPDVSELPDGYYALGHFGYPTHFAPNGYMLVARELKAGALAEPAGFAPVWDSAGLGSAHPAVFWKPNPMPGYKCFGLLVTTGVNIGTPPSTDEIRCVREDLTISAAEGVPPLADNFSSTLLWSADGTSAIVPFKAAQITPKKADWPPTAIDPIDAIYVGTFTGSSYGSVLQDMSLANWIDHKYVKHEALAPEYVKPLVELHGPHIWMHPDEIYYPDDPETVLDGSGSYLFWGLVYNEHDYDNFNFTDVGYVEVTSNNLMANYEYVTNLNCNPNCAPEFRTWIGIDDSWKPGNLFRAKALINVLPVDAIFTDIQFWLFYPFNGPGRVEVCPLDYICTYYHLIENGRHYSDWEHVTLRFVNHYMEKDAVTGMVEDRGPMLVGVYMSRHSSGQWFARNYFGSTLQFMETHPVVFSAKFSHAFYPDAYDQINYEVHRGVKGGIADFYLWDQTGWGMAFPAYADGDYEIVNSGIPGVEVVKKSWLEYPGRWGQYERLYDVMPIPVWAIVYPYKEEKIGSGPYGPVLKPDFIYGDPYEWYWSVKTVVE